MRKEWLTKKTTVAEAEAEDLALMKSFLESEGEALPANFKPFDHPVGRWDALVAGMQPGDELWWFESPWGLLSGCKGLAVVRQGEIVDFFVTVQS